jgi:DNA repair protein RecN (Recombination protein N)
LLANLSIRNFAIIEHLEVSFSKGMTVLTGETGAGKSIIIDAVSLLAGGRGSQSFIRSGSNKLMIQGLFLLPSHSITYDILNQLGIDYADNELVIQREIYQSGRNVCRVNGMLVNTTMLKQIGESIIDIHGQHEHQKLMQPNQHVTLLDEFGSQSLKQTLNQYLEQYQKYQSVKNRLQEKRNNQNQWSQRLDMLKYQVKEIFEAHLKDGEEEALTKERDYLLNYQKIVDSLSTSYELLQGNDTFAPLDMIGKAKSNIEDIAGMSSEFQDISSNIQNAYYLLQDAAANISDQIDLQEFDQSHLDEIESRLNLIYGLKHKYGDSIAKILNYYDNISHELAEMQEDSGNENYLEHKYSHISHELQKTAKQLSKQRHEVAHELENQVKQQLSDLYMDKARFEVHFVPLDDRQFHAMGNEKIEFYIQTNPGESMMPLEKIASGGELSRIMLALKTIFAKLQSVPTLIFDEVDTGVSGRVAQAIAEKISRISQQLQVLCITHLPQVAAISDQHYFIDKKVTNDRTHTVISKLNKKQRVEELARMLSGSMITDLTLRHAKELINLASENKFEKK